MKVNIQRIHGNWNLGYSLDKHSLKSVYIGDNQQGHPMFDTTRTEVGEALYQLKYQFDYNQVPPIGEQMYGSLSGYFSTASFIVPMPPSKLRPRQPVVEIARYIAKKMSIPCCESLLVKANGTVQMKDISNREDKIDALINTLSVNDQLGDGLYDVLIVDDLFDTGSSLEAATTTLRSYSKIRNIYAATVTRKR